MSYAERYLERWKPSKGWAKDYVRPAYVQCSVDPEAIDAIPAWMQLTIMLGDTRAAPLCLMVVLHARSLLADDADTSKLDAHLDLCLLDLGLGYCKDNAVALSELGKSNAIRRDGEKLGAWLLTELAPFDGDLQKAACFCLRLAALRTGVIDGPQEPTIAQLLDDDHWTVTAVAESQA